LTDKNTASVNLKTAEEKFEQFAKKTDEEIKQAEELAQNAAKAATTEKDRIELEKIGTTLKEIEKHHIEFDNNVEQVLQAYQ